MGITLEQAFDDARALLGDGRRITMLRVEAFSLSRVRIPARAGRLPGSPDLEISNQVAHFEFVDSRRQRELSGWTGPALNRFRDRFDARKLGDENPRQYWLGHFLALCGIVTGQPAKPAGRFGPGLDGGGYSLEAALNSTLLDDSAAGSLSVDASGLYRGRCEGDIRDRFGRPIAHASCEVSFRPMSVYLFG